MLALRGPVSRLLLTSPHLLLVFRFNGRVIFAEANDRNNLLDVARTFLGLYKTAAPPTPLPPQPMKVIGAGFARTGSDSLRSALNQIGFKSYHMREAFDQLHLPRWAAHARGELSSEEMLDLIALEGYNATTDFPTSLLTFELLERNPDAKVILSVRDSPEKWAESFISTVGAFAPITHRAPVRWLPNMAEMRVLEPWIDSRAGVVRGDDGLPTFDSSVAAYTAWARKVQEEVPPHQLLVHNSKDGWGPICQFLDLSSGGACPTGPYPHVNDAASMRGIVRAFSLMCDLFPLFVVAVAIGAVAVVRSVVVSRNRLLGKAKTA